MERLSSKKLGGSVAGKHMSPEEQNAKINETRKLIGPLANKLPALFSNASILRYLKARNWHTNKAVKMLKGTLKWRLDYKPEKIRWEDIANEAETGKVYRADYLDKYGRTVLVMRPGFQNTSSSKGQMAYLVYCLENAIMNLGPDQEQIVWLIDFQKWNMSSISMKVTRETAYVLQNHYPERLGLAIIYNPPKVFESFWAMVKPFVEVKTFKKVRFIYSEDPQSRQFMEQLFDVDKLESAFGGRNTAAFDYKAYGERMKEDDRRVSDLINYGASSPSSKAPVMSVATQQLECLDLEPGGTEGLDMDGFSSTDDETASSVSETVDEKVRSPPPLGCKDDANFKEATEQSH